MISKLILFDTIIKNILLNLFLWKCPECYRSDCHYREELNKSLSNLCAVLYCLFCKYLKSIYSSLKPANIPCKSNQLLWGKWIKWTTNKLYLFRNFKAFDKVPSKRLIKMSVNTELITGGKSEMVKELILKSKQNQAFPR